MMLHSLSDLNIPNAVITIGNFDGLHKGHLVILKKLKEIAAQNNSPTVIITFNGLTKNVPQIMSTEEKINMLNLMGISYIIVLNFNDSISKLSYKEFIELLSSHFPRFTLVEGEDFRFGTNREGDISLLLKLQDKYSFKVVVIPRLKLPDGTPISSTAIRNFIKEGKIEIANKMLERYFKIKGIVQKGTGEAKLIGFPSANIYVDNQIVPKPSTYITLTWIPSIFSLYPSLTFVNGNLTETYIINQHLTLYDTEIYVMFVSWLRDNIKFSSRKELKKQLEKDKENAIKWLRFNNTL